jgi:hypothetical protein
MSIDLRELLVAKQGQLSSSFEAARKALSHPVAKGDGSEMDWRKVIEDFLPQRYRVSRAFAVDADGQATDQLDIVIHDRQYCPLFFERGDHLYIPAESIYAVFEVKPELTKSTVGYASDKLGSVRKLRRTSIDIPHQGGTFSAPEPAPILGGILVGRSSWEDPLGDKLREALSEASERLDLGCTLAHGAFEVEWNSEDPELVKSSVDVGLIFFLMRLFTRLRDMRTVPAIDLDEYAKTLIQGS